MAHLQLSHTKLVEEAWRDIGEEQNAAQSAAIYEVIGAQGGDVKVVAFSPGDATLLSVIEYPDLVSAQRSVAGIIALRTLEFVSIQELWDLGEWTEIIRAASNG